MDEVEALRARVAELEADLRDARQALSGVAAVLDYYRRAHPLPGDEARKPDAGWRPGQWTPRITPDEPG